MNYKKKKKLDGLHLVNWEVAEAIVFQRQYALLLGMMVLVLLVYVVRMWHLQVLNGRDYRYQSENNRIRLEDIPSPRGIIFDRNGTPLVENRPAYHLQLIREDVQNMDQTVKDLALLCERPPEEFQGIVDANKSKPKFVPIRLLADLDRDCLARIEAQRIRLPGAVIQLEPKREYRCNGTAAHLIGYLSEITESELKNETYRGYYIGEDIGKFGVESAFEKYLHGKRGGRQVEVDAIGRRKRLLDEVLPIPGRNLWLTIDIELQRFAEASIEGRTGAIVALDPNTGEVLAMASSPTFDQERFIRGLTREEWNALGKDPRHPLLNRAIGAAYPPGSTYKPFVALAALKEGLITAETSFLCPGFYDFAGRKYRCWRDHGHGSMDVHRAIVQSCDVFFYQSGMRLGVDRLAQYANFFGLGEKSGIGLSGEQRGLIPTSRWKRQAVGVPWQKGETLSIAIGQGFDLATPLQMTLAFAAIANGGNLWQPYVVRRIEGSSSDEIDDMKPKLKRKIPIDAKYFQLVQQGLLGVVEDPRGTAHAVKDKTIPTAGKTGTAQVIAIAEGANRKLLAKSAKEEDRDHAWFVGYAPANDPQIVVGALIEHGGHGSSAAAPLVQKVIVSYLSSKMGASAQ
ncbi:MAG: penicillin-binding protein 2 [Syntrophobacteraceae bacterium]